MGVAYFLDRVQGDHLHRRLHWIKELTTAACAADLLTSHRCIAGQDNCLERWSHVEVQGLCGKGYQGCQHSCASCHIGVVQAILPIAGFNERIKQKRVELHWWKEAGNIQWLSHQLQWPSACFCG